MSSLLPSIGAMGLWGYWVIGLMAFFEALVLTSVFSPGTVVVVLGGALAAQGIFDIGDMMWFVGIGTILGSQASFWLGRKGENLFGGRRAILSAANVERGRHFFAKYGAASIVIGHFLGPLRPIAPVVAGLSGMDRRQFLIWNVAGGAAYAVAMVSVGYFFGTAFSIFGSSTTRVGLFVGAVLAVLLLLWFLISRTRRGLPFVTSVLGSVTIAVRDNADVRAFVARHPMLFRFLAKRGSRQTFSGLPATLLGLTFFYFLALYAESVLEFLDHDGVVKADTRLANLIYTVRSDGLTRFFTIITGLSYWRGALVVALAATVLMWIWDRRHYIPALWLTLIGNVLTVTALKLVFARPRPDFALYSEGSYAFPSGHSATIATLCLFLTYVLVRERIGRDLLWMLLGASIVFLVGLSRLYLNEHFLSDVLNGYVVGVLWAITGMFSAEQLRNRWRPVAAQTTAVRHWWATTGVIAVTTVALWLVLDHYSLTLRRELPTREAQLTMPIDQAFEQGVLPARSESLLGTPQEAVSIILHVPTEATVLDAMAAAGWRRADPPGFTTLAWGVIAPWLDRPYDTAPLIPLFWNGWPQDLGFEKIVTAKGVRQRHHVRFWRVRMQNSSGLRAYVGTASFDVGIDWGLAHRIDPNVDAERDHLVADLLRDGRAQQDGWTQIAAPMFGQNVVGDPILTDGRIAILTTPNATGGLQETQ